MKEDKDKKETPQETAETIKEDTEEELEKILDEDTTEETTETEETPEQPTEEKETKPLSKKKKEDEEEIAEERTYTIPLGKALIKPPKKRAPKAMRMVRAFITKHMKLTAKTTDDEEEREAPTLTITKEVNEKIWGKGIEKPPRKIRVRATKDKDGNVTVHLAEVT